MTVRFFAGFHDCAGGLQESHNDECENAAQHSPKTHF